MKQFNVKFNIGKIKYLVSYHDGEKKHEDGSDFFDIAILKSKKRLNEFTKDLQKNGYIQKQ